ncbi:hypothetical protein L861_06400 [Litchfieldella anticariensis FP35 = DSM 16096]|uniref:DUF2857 domain-containing protein n=1 Tax=Litchfieldella anticariensis (strain DSM 16096 / CECT 5854 / CIP 108499 / LMG 22089 / FP35) TaxID=1121939 RepID=S2KYU1_LITA3|nr:DUF2857 domain-containing protein [Halomonas anticariensis]EPC00564.1 hypothetical protein L861_06400 [Halomonas anticariensis FP35 = DSM 16096]
MTTINQHLNHALLTQVMALLREGNMRKALALGFSEDELRTLRRMRASEIESLACTGRVFARFSVDHQALKGILSRLDEDQDRESLIDRCLRLGASVSMMGTFFGLTTNDCASRRQLLGIEPRQGRLAMPSEGQEHDAWERWQHIAPDPRDAEDVQGMITLASETGLPLAVIWHLVKQWAEPDQPRTTVPAEECVHEGVT